MKPHQQRVVDERNDLEARLDKLTAFCSTPTFESLPEAECDRLVRQAGIMVQLSDVLLERIDAFPTEPRVPADVLAAVDRMSNPIHESWGIPAATCDADARSMATIKAFIDSLVRRPHD